jgi:hypothetical protein
VANEGKEDLGLQKMQLLTEELALLLLASSVSLLLWIVLL